MFDLRQSSDFESIVTDAIPLIDVRAPVEFEKGAFPNAINLPLMSDEERRLVGICYKEQGNDKAVELGHELIGAKVKEERVEMWLDFIAAHPDSMLYCFRGGQRSGISQEWIAGSGVDIVRLEGGYKAFRRYLIDETNRAKENFSPTILGGRTGSGKTILLQSIPNAIDLEALANHRGSSFGRQITAQPSQIDFENALAYSLIEKRVEGFGTLIFEDEGRNIGKLYLPDTFAYYLAEAPLIILETDIEKRIDITFEEYVVIAQDLYRQVGGNSAALQQWREDIQSAMKRIQKRLGGLRYEIVSDIFEHAFEEQMRDGSLDGHREWIEYLLAEYYDPMYDYQIQKRSDQIIFRGDHEEVLNFYISKEPYAVG